jgi:hypothetical protein
MSSVRSGRVIDAALQRKGFNRTDEGDHLWYFLPRIDGEGYLVRTKMSHGMMGETVGVELIVLMARQCRLTKKQFLSLIDCPIDETEYREILRQQGLK